METPPGEMLRSLGMVPVLHDGRVTNLGAGMLLVVPAVLIGAVVLLAGTRHLAREMALVQAQLRSQLSRIDANGENPPANDPAQTLL
jgi:MFS transporter, Spinster family, sphingosine-1-phosphate transporter